jgi:ATP-binding cassette subfamily B protein
MKLKQYWHLLTRYLSPQSPRVLLLTVLLLSSTSLQLVSPQILRHSVDTAKEVGS